MDYANHVVFVHELGVYSLDPSGKTTTPKLYDKTVYTIPTAAPKTVRTSLQKLASGSITKPDSSIIGYYGKELARYIAAEFARIRGQKGGIFGGSDDDSAFIAELFGDSIGSELGLGHAPISEPPPSDHHPHHPHHPHNSTHGDDASSSILEDIFGLDEMDEPPSSHGDTPISTLVHTSASTSTPAHAPTSIVVSQTANLFPDEKMTSLKNRIQLLTGISSYRQHTFVIDENNRTRQSYSVTRSHYEIEIDIRHIFDQEMTDEIRGRSILGIDMGKVRLDARKSRVYARDDFTIMEHFLRGTPNSSGIGANFHHVYVLDIDELVRPIASHIISTILDDSYQSNIFYYGLIYKYWPQFSKAIFDTYIRSPKQIQIAYPLFADTTTALQTRFSYADPISIDAYAIRRSEKASEPYTISITQMLAVSNSGRGQATPIVNLRNLFDKMRARRSIPEIHLYATDSLGGPIISSSGGGGYSQKFLVVKKNVRTKKVVFPSSPALKMGVVFAVSLDIDDWTPSADIAKANKTTAKYADRSASSGIITAKEKTKYLFVSVRANGSIVIRAVWNDDDYIDFSMAVQIIANFVNVIIDDINDYGSSVVTGAKIAKINPSNLTFSELRVAVNYNLQLTGSAFATAQKAWAPYESGEIANTKIVTSKDEMLFRRGVYRYDVDTIDKVLSGANKHEIAKNQYEYKHNGTIRQRWNQNYLGKALRMINKSTGVQFLIIDVYKDEFDTFLLYLQQYVKHVRAELKKSPPSHSIGHNVKLLRRLREIDPDLYDLKKYESMMGKSAIVPYSVLCQSNRQPFAYTEDEYQRLSKDKKKAAVRYWNFTDKRPQYYTCPTKTYPSLGFIVNHHPLGYCLPCCNKSVKYDKSAETKRAQVTSTCMAEYIFGIAADKKSRHVLKYGKQVTPERLSYIAPGDMSLVLNPKTEFVVGAKQYSRLPIMGALGAALIMKPTEIIDVLVEDIDAHSQYESFIVGTRFSNLREFADHLRELCTADEENQVLVTRDPYAGYTDIIIELLRQKMSIGVFTFVDIEETGKPQIYAAPPGCTSYIILIRMGSDIHNIFTLDPIEFLNDDRAIRVYPATSPTIESLSKIRDYGAMIAHTEFVLTASSMLRRREISDSLAALQGWRVTKIFTGKDGSVYAIEMAQNANAIVLATTANEIIDESTTLDIAVITATVPDYTEYDGVSALELAAILGCAKLYRNREDHIIGVSTQLIKTTMWFAPISKSDASKLINSVSSVPSELVLYSPTKLAAAMVEKRPPTLDQSTTELHRATYDVYQYALISRQFIGHLRRERNKKMRARIESIATNSDGIVIDDIANVLRKYAKDTPSYAPFIGRDMQILDNIFGSTGMSETHKQDVASHIALFGLREFMFDFSTLLDIRAEEDATATNIIIDNLGESMMFDKNALPPYGTSMLHPKFPNVYGSCIDNPDLMYCKNGKLICTMNKKVVASFLLNDLRNDLKLQSLLLSSANVVHNMRFSKTGAESLAIYRL